MLFVTFFLKIGIVIDKKVIKKVCIDNFALKLKEKYDTVMIDIDTKKVVHMLNSRDYQDVKNGWIDIQLLK